MFTGENEPNYIPLQSVSNSNDRISKIETIINSHKMHPKISIRSRFLNQSTIESNKENNA